MAFSLLAWGKDMPFTSLTLYIINGAFSTQKEGSNCIWKTSCYHAIIAKQSHY